MNLDIRLQESLVLVLLLALLISLVKPVFPQEQYLQHAPMPVVLPVLFVMARRRQLSNAAFSCVVAFLLLHVIGARYIYSYVPCGERLSIFGLGDAATGRNNYDRLVHLAFGMLATVPLAEICQKFGGWNRYASALFALSIVLGASALYEVFEWLLAIVAAPEFADRYNGQQGDTWDAQKDMALALLGSIIVLPVVWRYGTAEPCE